MTAREPRGPTLVDLMVLVAGFALGIVLDRAMRLQPPDPAGTAAASAFQACWHVATWMRWLATAVALVAVVRRARFGGVYGAGEFCAVFLLSGSVYAAYRLAGMDLWSLAPELMSRYVGWDVFTTRVVPLAALGLSVAVVAPGRHLPAWLVGIGVAMFMLIPCSILFELVLLRASDIYGSVANSAALWVVEVVSQLPLFVAAVAATFPRPEWAGRRPWTDPAGVVASVSTWAASYGAGVAIRYVGAPYFRALPLPAELAGVVTSWSLALVLVFCAGPAVVRRFRRVAPARTAAEPATSPAS